MGKYCAISTALGNATSTAEGNALKCMLPSHVDFLG